MQYAPVNICSFFKLYWALVFEIKLVNIHCNRHEKGLHKSSSKSSRYQAKIQSTSPVWESKYTGDVIMQPQATTYLLVSVVLCCSQLCPHSCCAKAGFNQMEYFWRTSHGHWLKISAILQITEIYLAMIGPNQQGVKSSGKALEVKDVLWSEKKSCTPGLSVAYHATWAAC